MLDGNTLLFVLACGLFVVSWCSFFYSIATAFAEATGADRGSDDIIAFCLSICLMVASGMLHWQVGTWGWFAWPWAAIAMLIALLIATSRFALGFRIAAPVVLTAVSAALLFPVFS